MSQIRLRNTKFIRMILYCVSFHLFILKYLNLSTFNTLFLFLNNFRWQENCYKKSLFTNSMSLWRKMPPKWKKCLIYIIKITEICECKSGYIGYDCGHKLTCGHCGIQNCDSDHSCKKCPTGWGGSECTERLCENFKICGDHGFII